MAIDFTRLQRSALDQGLLTPEQVSELEKREAQKKAAATKPVTYDSITDSAVKQGLISPELRQEKNATKPVTYDSITDSAVKQGLISPQLRQEKAPKIPDSVKQRVDTDLAVVHHAVKYLNTPYVWGGRSRKGFDCSGFAQTVYGDMGYKIPGTAHEQWDASIPITRDQLQPGDLVFQRGTQPKKGKDYVSHVGVYLGNGIIEHASTGSKTVIMEKLWEERPGRWLGYGRPNVAKGSKVAKSRTKLDPKADFLIGGPGAQSVLAQMTNARPAAPPVGIGRKGIGDMGTPGPSITLPKAFSPKITLPPSTTEAIMAERPAEILPDVKRYSPKQIKTVADAEIKKIEAKMTARQNLAEMSADGPEMTLPDAQILHALRQLSKNLTDTPKGIGKGYLRELDRGAIQRLYAKAVSEKNWELAAVTSQVLREMGRTEAAVTQEALDPFSMEGIGHMLTGGGGQLVLGQLGMQAPEMARTALMTTGGTLAGGPVGAAAGTALGAFTSGMSVDQAMKYPELLAERGAPIHDAEAMEEWAKTHQIDMQKARATALKRGIVLGTTDAALSALGAGLAARAARAARAAQLAGRTVPWTKTALTEGAALGLEQLSEPASEGAGLLAEGKSLSDPESIREMGNEWLMGLGTGVVQTGAAAVPAALAATPEAFREAAAVARGEQWKAPPAISARTKVSATKVEGGWQIDFDGLQVTEPIPDDMAPDAPTAIRIAQEHPAYRVAQLRSTLRQAPALADADVQLEQDGRIRFVGAGGAEGYARIATPEEAEAKKAANPEAYEASAAAGEGKTAAAWVDEDGTLNFVPSRDMGLVTHEVSHWMRRTGLVTDDEFNAVVAWWKKQNPAKAGVSDNEAFAYAVQGYTNRQMAPVTVRSVLERVREVWQQLTSIESRAAYSAMRDIHGGRTIHRQLPGQAQLGGTISPGASEIVRSTMSPPAPAPQGVRDNERHGVTNGVTDSGPETNMRVLNSQYASPELAAGGAEVAPSTIKPPTPEQPQGALFAVSPEEEGDLARTAATTAEYAAQNIQPTLDAIGEATATAVGGSYRGTPKSGKSIVAKVTRKRKAGEDYDVLSPKDHARGAIIVNDWGDAPAVISELLRQGFAIESTIDRPLNQFGYRGINATKRLAEGYGGEIQVHTTDSWALKLQTDEIYRRWRDSSEIRTAPLLVREKYKADIRQSVRAWKRYWDAVPKAGRAAISASVSGMDSVESANVTPTASTQRPSSSTWTPQPSSDSRKTRPSLSRENIGSDSIQDTSEDILPQDESDEQGASPGAEPVEFAVAPPEDSPEFRAWFKDSRARKYGKPIDLYHGTGYAGFREFDPELFDDGALFGPGIYLTDDPDVASGYAGSQNRALNPTHETLVRATELLKESDRYKALKDTSYVDMMLSNITDPSVPLQDRVNSFMSLPTLTLADVGAYPFNSSEYWVAAGGQITGPGVYKLHASIQNPFYMDSPMSLKEARRIYGLIPGVTPQDVKSLREGYPNGFRSGEEFWNTVRDRLSWTPDRSRRPAAKVREAQRTIIDALKAAGYDGITHMGGGRVSRTSQRHEVFIVWDKAQVKSVWNSGAYGQDTGDISFAVATEPEEAAPLTREQQRAQAWQAKRGRIAGVEPTDPAVERQMEGLDIFNQAPDDPQDLPQVQFAINPTLVDYVREHNVEGGFTASEERIISALSVLADIQGAYNRWRLEENLPPVDTVKTWKTKAYKEGNADALAKLQALAAQQGPDYEGETKGTRQANMWTLQKYLDAKPDQAARVREAIAGINQGMFRGDGRLDATPIEEVWDSENERPVYLGFARSLPQFLIDRLSYQEFEALRSKLVKAQEQAYKTERTAARAAKKPKKRGVPRPKGLPMEYSAMKSNKSLSSLGSQGDDYRVESVLRGAEKTEAALNFNSACPEFIIGNRGCWGACYVTSMGKGANGINYFERAMYTGEILQLSDEWVKQLNRDGGVRINGVGDTTAENMNQKADAIRHARMRGLKIKLITKKEASLELLKRMVEQGEDVSHVTVQTSGDYYWIPVLSDLDTPHSGIADMTGGGEGLRKYVEEDNADAIAALYGYYGKEVKKIDGVWYRKDGFTHKQTQRLLDTYTPLGIKITPRLIVGAAKEILDALLGPPCIVTWMHGTLMDGIVSEISGPQRNYGPSRHMIKWDSKKKKCWVGASSDSKHLDELVQLPGHKEVQDLINAYPLEQRKELVRRFRARVCCQQNNEKDACAACGSYCALRSSWDSESDARYDERVEMDAYSRYGEYDMSAVDPDDTGGNTPWREDIDEEGGVQFAVSAEEDRAYLDAVERGDMDTAQRMVDAAARRAGYEVGPVYHGTASEFTSFGEPLTDNGLWFAFDKDYAEEYATTNGGKSGRILSALLKVQNIFDTRNPEHKAVFEQWCDDEIGMESDDGTGFAQDSPFPHWSNNNRLFDLTRPLGFDAIITSDGVRNGRDTVGIGVLNPTNVKSADPVTRDDSGRVIPLSERFNEAKDDIRFAVGPSGAYQGEKYVGSRNMYRAAFDTMSNPEQVQEKLAQFYGKNKEIIDEWRRKGMTFEEIKEAAGARTQFWTPARFRKAKRGVAYNPEDALAMDMAWMGLGEAVHDAYQAYRSDTSTANLTALYDAIDNYNIATTVTMGAASEQGRALASRKIRRDMIRQAGGNDALLRDALARQGIPLTAAIVQIMEQLDPADTVSFYRLLARASDVNAKVGDHLHTIAYTNMLSGTSPHIVNGVQNILNLGASRTSYALAAGLDKMYSAMTGEERTLYFAPALMRAARASAFFEVLPTLQEAARNAQTVWREGFTERQARKFELTTHHDLPQVTIKGKKYTNPAQYPLRALAASDEMVRTVAIQMSINEQCVTHAINNLKRTRQGKFTADDVIEEAMRFRGAELDSNPEIIAEAERYADTVLQTREPGKFLGGAMRLVNTEWFGHWRPLKHLSPFMLVPSNVTKTGMEYSPLGLVKAAYPGVSRKDREIAVAQATLGTLVMSGMVSLGLAGLLDYSDDWDEDRGIASLKQTKGQKPWAVRVRGTKRWIPLNTFGPVAPGLYGVAEAVTAIKSGDAKTAGKVFVAGLHGMQRGVLDSNFLVGINSMLDVITQRGPEAVYATDRAIANFANQFVPASGLMGQIANATDKTARDTRRWDDSGLLEPAGAMIKSRIPGLRQTLPKRVDVLGREVPQNPTGLAAFNRLVGTVDKPDPVADELIRIRYAPSFVGKEFSRDKVTYSLDRKQWIEYQKAAGSAAYPRLSSLFDSEHYQNADVKDQREMARDVVMRARADVRNQIRREVVGDEPASRRAPKTFEPRQKRQKRTRVEVGS